MNYLKYCEVMENLNTYVQEFNNLFCPGERLENEEFLVDSLLPAVKEYTIRILNKLFETDYFATEIFYEVWIELFELEPTERDFERLVGAVKTYNKIKELGFYQ